MNNDDKTNDFLAFVESLTPAQNNVTPATTQSTPVIETNKEITEPVVEKQEEGSTLKTNQESEEWYNIVQSNDTLKALILDEKFRNRLSTLAKYNTLEGALELAEKEPTTALRQAATTKSKEVKELRKQLDELAPQMEEMKSKLETLKQYGDAEQIKAATELLHMLAFKPESFEDFIEQKLPDLKPKIFKQKSPQQTEATVVEDITDEEILKMFDDAALRVDDLTEEEQKAQIKFYRSLRQKPIIPDNSSILNKLNALEQQLVEQKQLLAKKELELQEKANKVAEEPKPKEAVPTEQLPPDKDMEYNAQIYTELSDIITEVGGRTAKQDKSFFDGVAKMLDNNADFKQAYTDKDMDLVVKIMERVVKDVHQSKTRKTINVPDSQGSYNQPAPAPKVIKDNGDIDMVAYLDSL